MPQKVGSVAERYGRLRPVEYVKGKGWRCICDCGVEKMVMGGNLRRGNVLSCGCWRSEMGVKRGLANINKMRAEGKQFGWAVYNANKKARVTGVVQVRPMLLKKKKNCHNNCWVCRRPARHMLCMRCYGHDSRATEKKVGKPNLSGGERKRTKQTLNAA